MGLLEGATLCLRTLLVTGVGAWIAHPLAPSVSSRESDRTGDPGDPPALPPRVDPSQRAHG